MSWEREWCAGGVKMRPDWGDEDGVRKMEVGRERDKLVDSSAGWETGKGEQKGVATGRGCEKVWEGCKAKHNKPLVGMVVGREWRDDRLW